MSKGRGANHRRRNSRQKAAIGCYNSHGSASHCIGPNSSHRHHQPADKKRQVAIHTPTSRSWWERVKDWVRGKSLQAQAVVAPKAATLRLEREIHRKKGAGDVKAERAQTIMRQKRNNRGG